MALNTRRQAVFRYKTVKGPLHKLPALLKLLLLLPLSIFCMSLPPLWLAVGIAIAVISAFLCKFTLRELLTDLKPAALYAALMYILSVFSGLFELFADAGTISLSIFYPFNLAALSAILLPRPDFLRIALRLVLIIQISALLFRTTSSLEIRQALPQTRFFKTRFIQTRFIQTLALFLSFIPEIFSTWSSINLAWKARGGKEGIRKIKAVVFILISISMEKAAVKSKALIARNGI
ncbi:MAG: energy-coupling factor transporter transmembrane protein EcfT [Treponema sp.]|jgi:energy-coupling factor transporter transmembrane protein EcfT|nr:energy-coupling factor transporter transmembrane protein EcfT [Treponema sp.]